MKCGWRELLILCTAFAASSSQLCAQDQFVQPPGDPGPYKPIGPMPGIRSLSTPPSSGSPVAQSPKLQSPTLRPQSAGVPPAFGPGSENYGKPFFHAPKQSPSGAFPIPTPRDYPPLSSPVEKAHVGEVHNSSPSQVSPTVVQAAPNSPTGEHWRFNFQGAPWPVVLKNFARASDMSLVMDQEPSGTFTYYDDRQYEFSEALDVLNDHLLREGFLLVRNERKLTSVSTRSELRDGTVPFASLRDLPSLGRNELVSVAFPLRGQATSQTVEEVGQILTPIGKVLLLSNSNRLIVTDTGSSLRRLHDLLSGSGMASSDVSQFVVRLRNSKALDVASAINQRLGYGASDSAGAGAGVVSASATMAASSTVGVVPEEQTNSLLIQGTPEELAQVQSLISELDRDPGQVMIQALLVEVLLGNTQETGVELGFQDSVLFDRSIIDNVVTIAETVTNPNGLQTTNQRIISQSAAPGFPFNGAPLGNNTSVNPGLIGKQSVSNLGLGRVSGDLGFGGLVLSAGSNSVNVLLRALAERHKIDVLSRPHVRAVNNHEALIQIGQQVPVVDGVTITPNGTANPVVRQDKAGVILRVTPRIGDHGAVQIEVQAEKSAYQLVPGSGVPIFTDATTGNVIEAPVKDITTAQTTVTAISGQTIVLGGMITRDESSVERKVPLLGDIPFIGRLFRVDLKQSNRKELLIFLTPTIVGSAAQSDCIASQEATRMNVSTNPHVDLHRDFLGIHNPTHQPHFEPSGLIEELPSPGLIESLPARQ